MNTNQSFKTSGYREEPMALIEYDPRENKYMVNPEALELIQSIPAPLGIVAVAGMYRTGKSYLLNRMLLNRSNGFGVGPTVNACTKGLWIWGKPVIGQTAEGEPINVLLIDSEGIGALDESHNHDNKVFALTILISSMFIYNSMGSIDENAVQNLSLVVNLTKNIQIKSNQKLNNTDDVDSEDYAQYFPSFFWVVRDFTLQLVDQKGESISSKEYLEKALALQKGFSDSVESKNRIRRLLTTFFRERDCVTLVRPLTNEENLQNLDKMEFGDLRPEFFEQIINFRKKVLNRVRPKTLNSRLMSGEMMGTLIGTYVQSINEGAVPNIENAWSYICKSQCYKAMGDAIDAYERTMKESTVGKYPMGPLDLKQFHQVAKQNAINIFKKKAIGEVVEEFTKEFHQKLKVKYTQIKNDNEKEGYRSCMNFIQQDFVTIERKLKNHEYQMYSEYEMDIKLFHQYFLENGPQTTNKNVIILEFIQKVLADGANYFFRNITREFDIQQSISQNEQQKLQQEVEQSRKELNNNKNSYMVRINQLEAEKGEMEGRENHLKEQMDNMTLEKNKQEQYLREEIQKERQRASKDIQELRQKLMQKEDSSKDQERNLMFKESEFDKTMALYQQKINYLEKNNEELQKKEKEMSEQLKNNKKDYQLQMKENLSKHEQQAKSQQSKIHGLNEKVLELENDLATNLHNFDMERKKWQLGENQLQQNNLELQRNMDQMVRELKELKNNEEKYLELNNQSSKIREEELRQQVDQLQLDLKAKSEGLKQFKIESDREKAILQQKSEFMEMQMEGLQKQVAENKRTYENMIKAFQSNKKENNNGQLQEVKNKYQQEMQQMQEEWETSRTRLTREIENITEKYGDLELKYKCELNEQLKENEQLNEQLAEVKGENRKHQETIKQLDENKQLVVQEQEQRYHHKIRQLEQQIEDYKQKLHGDQAEHEKQSEDKLGQLKNFYELEKERLEKKLHEDKQKYDKKLLNLQNEYEEKQREEQLNYEDELDCLKDEIKQMDMQMGQMEFQMKHDMELKEQQLDNQDKHIRELKEQLLREQQSLQHMQDQVQQKYSIEIKNLQEKLENAQNELSRREKNNLGLQHQQEQVVGQLQRKEEQYEQTKRQLIEDRDSLQNRLDETREKYQALSNEYMEKKMEFEKQIALLTQQSEFLNKKHQETIETYQESMQKYEERIHYFEKEFTDQQEEKIKKVIEDKDSIVSKFESYKKEQKEKDLQRSRQLAHLEKDKAVVEEKYLNLELKKKEIEERFKEENNKLSLQIQEFKVQMNNGSSEQKQIIDRLKDKLQESENHRQEINSNYQRDSVLWANKQKFQEQQCNQYKEELIQNKEQFEMTLQHLTAKMESEHSESFQETINQVKEEQENKYKLRIRDIEDNFHTKIFTYQETIKKMEREIKNLNERIMLDNQGKLGSLNQNEKKIQELTEKEQRYLVQIQQLKQERDNKIHEYQEMLDRERNSLKEKIQIVEARLQDSEKKKSNMLFEHEKERTKWNTERDIIMGNKDQLQEDLQKVEKKKETLLRENEKLRTENRASRKSQMYSTQMFGQQRQSRLVGQSPSNRQNFSIMQQLGEQGNTSMNEDDRSQKSEQSFNDGNNVFRQTQNFGGNMPANPLLNNNTSNILNNNSSYLQNNNTSNYLQNNNNSTVSQPFNNNNSTTSFGFTNTQNQLNNNPPTFNSNTFPHQDIKTEFSSNNIYRYQQQKPNNQDQQS